MINHARTLLLNARPGGGYPGTEYVPETYVPVTLNSHLNSVRQVLFGARPDKFMLNYRAQQLLAAVQSTELQQYVLALDPRLTYDPSKSDDMFRHPFGLSFAQLADSEMVIYPGGDAGISSDVTGRIRKSWRISLSNTEGDDGCTVTFDIFDLFETTTPIALCSSTTNTLITLREQPNVGETVVTVEYTEGLSEPVYLPGTDYFFRVHLPDGDQLIDATADIRPTQNLADLLQRLDALGEPTHLAMFGVGSAAGATEPLQTCYKLWKDSLEATYRISAAVLALIYQTEAARSHA